MIARENILAEAERRERLINGWIEKWLPVGPVSSGRRPRLDDSIALVFAETGWTYELNEEPDQYPRLRIIGFDPGI